MPESSPAETRAFVVRTRPAAREETMQPDTEPDDFDVFGDESLMEPARRAFFRRLGYAAGGTAAAAALLAPGAPAGAAQAALLPSLAQAAPPPRSAVPPGARFNVRDFGAAGNGATDDTASVQSAMTAAVAAGGGTVLFPPGKYLITAPLSHAGSTPIILEGEGDRQSVLVARGNFDSLLLLEGGAYGSAVITGGAITGVAITWGGLYRVPPRVTIRGNGRVAPTAEAILGPDGRVTDVRLSGGSRDFTRALVAFSRSRETSLGVQVYRLGFVTGRTATACVHVAKGVWQHHFDGCRFFGDGNVSLVKHYGDFGNFRNSTWAARGSQTVALDIMGRSINCQFSHCRIGGKGNGIRIQTRDKAGGFDRPQGTNFTDVHLFCTGAYNLYASESLFLTFVGCWFTEASGNQALFDQRADGYIFDSCYFGGSRSNVSVEIGADTGNFFAFRGCTFNHGANGISVRATRRGQLDCLIVADCLFQGLSTSCLDLDSVGNAIIANNIDRSRPKSGSWVTRSSHARNKGEYTFDGNHWHRAPPAVFATAATYHWGNDTGIVMRARGTFSAVETRSAAAPHGLSRTPSWCQGTPTRDVGRYWNSVKDSRRIGFTWSQPASPDWHWEAEV